MERNPTTGTIKAASGKHDDVVLAWGIGQTVLRTATNLDEWGIIRGAIPPDKIDKTDPKNKLQLLQKILEALPDDMKKSLGLEEMNKNPLTEFEKNHEEIRKQEARYKLNENKNHLMEDEELDIDPYDNAAMDALDEDIFNINTMGQNTKFDIGDFI